MSIDYNFLFPCTHVNSKYLINNCPVCLGTGFYFDMVLGQDGQPQQSGSLNKAVQEIIHLFSTDEGKYLDYGYPEYGSKILKFVGSKNLTEGRLKFQVLRDLQYIDYIKDKQHQLFKNIDITEIINNIVAIKTTNDYDTQSIELSCIIGDDETIQNFTVKQFHL